MNTPSGSSTEPVPDGHGGAAWRRGSSALLAVVGALALTVALLAGWIERNVFDSAEFAARATRVLDDGTVRRGVAEAITERLEADGVSDAVSYHFVLLPIVEDVVATPAFEQIFRSAVEQADRVVVNRHAATATLELGETIEILTSSSAVVSPGLASALEAQGSSLLIDAGPVLERLRPYRIAERVRLVDDLALVVAVAAFVAAVALDRDRRRAIEGVGVAISAAGSAVLLVVWLGPRVAARRIDDDSLRQAVTSATERFVSDLSVIGIWTVAIGLIVAAASVATGVPRVDARAGFAAAWNWAQRGRVNNAVAGTALLLAGAALVVARAALIDVVFLIGGAALLYVGAVLCMTASFGAAASRADAGTPRARRGLAVAAGAVLAVGLAAGVALTVHAARSTARADGELVCNGDADLCDRRLDQVALAGVHNAMSAASSPGWLFPENLTGIRSQLDFGIRALLIKTHYGTPTGVRVDGAELVVTDTAAESDQDATDEVAELSPQAVERAQELEATVPDETATRDVYLCHVYCTLGATKFSDALAEIHRFVDRRPSDVLVLFIGDYVSPDDTAASIERAGLLDHVWTYDTSSPPPTLREMIDAGRTLLILSEHHGGDPAWYTKGYGIFQDTPFTFADAGQFSCRQNRGPADAPLFELNHFITNSRPPSVDVAKQVNAYDVLMNRARTCMAERGLMPTIVAVNFYQQGNLLEVVADLNADAPTDRAGPTDSSEPTDSSPD